MKATNQSAGSNLLQFWQQFYICLKVENIVATLAINLLNLALPIVILQLYDRIIPNQATQTFSILIVCLVVVVILDTILRMSRTLLMNKLGSNFEYNNILQLMNGILRSDFTAFESRRHSDYLEKITALEKVRDTQFGQDILSLLDLPFVLLFLAMIGFFTGWLVLIPLVLLALFTGFSMYIGRSLYRALIDQDYVLEHRHNFLLELLQGIQTVKPLAMEKKMLRYYENLQEKSASIIYRLVYINNLLQASTTTLSQLTVVLFVGIGAFYAVSGDVTVGALAASSMLAGRLLQPTSRALHFWIQWLTTRLAEQKVEKLLALPSEPDQEGAEKLTLNGAVDIRNVRLTLVNNSAPIFDGLSLSVEPNELITIMGDNGSGKTTLSKLLLGLINPDLGSIEFDGKSIKEIDRTCLRQQIGFVPQRGVLLNGTILDNLTAYRSGDSVDQALEYCQTLGLEENIMRMIDGLATVVDSSLIDNMPEGLRQRIVMVRALVGPIKIIIYDDANAGYDLENEKKLVEFFKSIKGTKTVIVMSDQESLITISDHCYKLVDGALIKIFSSLDEQTKQSKSVQIAPSNITVTGGR